MNSNLTIQVTSNADQFLNAMKSQVEKALTIIGLKAEGYAQVSLTQSGAVDTGNLRNSISNKVVTEDKEHAVYVGTNVEYAPYIEFGTGIYYPGGRKTPWFYEGSDGNYYRTEGMKARPYLRPSISDHTDEYQQIIKTELQQ